MNLIKFIGGVLAFTFGIWLFWYLVKNPIDTEHDVNKAMLQGYITAIATIALGFILILTELNKL